MKLERLEDKEALAGRGPAFPLGKRNGAWKEPSGGVASLLTAYITTKVLRTQVQVTGGQRNTAVFKVQGERVSIPLVRIPLGCLMRSNAESR